MATSRSGLVARGTHRNEFRRARLGIRSAPTLALAVALALTTGAEAHAQGDSPPQTTITIGPGETHRLGSASFAFTSSDQSATFECSLDDSEFVACGQSPTFHVGNGSHELDVRAVSAAGTPDPTPAHRQWWADALVQNGNFETPARGWSVQGYTIPAWLPYGATAIANVGGGAAGDRALSVRATSNTTPSVYASPYPVNSAAAGATYTLRGQFRSDQPGEKVCLRIRERSGSSAVASKQSCAKTTQSWTHFAPITLTTAQDGSGLAVDVYQSSAASAGETFEVDGIELTEDAPPGAVPAAAGDPTLLAASDIASCWSSGDEAVARMLDTMPGPIAVPGDTEQNRGSADEFAGCYDPSWGRHKPRTYPAVGDHEYKTPGATGYFNYFGAAAGDYGKGWYSYDLGSWHIVVLNSNCANVGGCGAGSEQYEWLKDDLEQNGGDCIGAYWHHPLFSAGSLHGGLTRSRPFWNLLYQYGAEWALNGNDHAYQRFAPQTPTGALDREAGMRQFIVATGGTRLDALGAPLPNTEVQNNTAFGVLQLGLHEASYDWEFVPQPGKTFTDSGATPCSALDLPPETTLESGPVGTVGSDGATFTFSADQEDADFRCSLDDQPFSPCSSPRDYTGLSEGEHVFRVQAVSRLGTADETPASRTWTVAVNNLLPNGGFEGSLTGWIGFQSALSLATGGPDGESFARVVPEQGASSYAINTSPRPVKSSEAGVRYQAGGWFRSEIPGAKVCLNIRERANGSQKTTAACRKATGGWDRFPAATHAALGGGSIEVFVSATAGPSFDVDGLSLVKLP